MQTSLRAVFASLPGALVLVSYFAPWIRIWEPETFKVRVNVDKKIYLMGTSIAIAILLSFLAW